ncbi:unnamed protein product, partial [Adineta ricciae]
WLNDHVQDNPSSTHTGTCNMSFSYQISSGGTLHISRLRRALHSVVTKHESLRTSLFFDVEKNILMQRIIEPDDNDDDNSRLFTLSESSFKTEDELNKIIYDERTNTTHFDLSGALVFRCHAAHRKQSVSSDQLCEGDVLIFSFHRALFDVPSIHIFLHDLNKAYAMEQVFSECSNCLRYIDYSVAERDMPMITASTFWAQALQDYDIDRPMPLPFIEHHAIDGHRTRRRVSTSFDFDHDLSQAILTFASTDGIQLQWLYLTIYYIFLFKMANGEQDLCVTMNTDGRYQDELKSIIGIFGNIIPLRCRIDPRSSFTRLAEDTLLMTTRSFHYSYFPFERILAQCSINANPTFLNTSFTFYSHTTHQKYAQVKLDDVSLQGIFSPNTIHSNMNMHTSDFSLSLEHDLTINRISLTVDTSADLFSVDIVDKFAQRFFLLSKCLFGTDIDRPVCELSVVLPDEITLIQSFRNTEIVFPPFGCVHHEFSRQIITNSQKLAIVLDKQSLTYSELLFHAQHVALYLGQRQKQIICQCMERSIEMIIGQMAILFSGAAYCALSPEDPVERLAALVKQVGSQHILIHPSTRNKFDEDVSLCLHDLIIILSSNNASQETSVDIDGVFPCTQRHDLAYIIFTSGSTGSPKLVQITHENIVACMLSFTHHLDVFTHHDIFVQYAQCSFDVHIQESWGTLMIGGSLVLLHPSGHLDLEYLSAAIFCHNVTYLAGVPSLALLLCDYLEKTGQREFLTRIKAFGFLGMYLIAVTTERICRRPIADSGQHRIDLVQTEILV